MVGISVDSAYSHRQFRDDRRLTFPLLSDRLATVAAEFGARYDSWATHPAVCQRAVFAVDDSHTVRYRWVAEDATEQPTIEEIKASIGWLE